MLRFSIICALVVACVSAIPISPQTAGISSLVAEGGLPLDIQNTPIESDISGFVSDADLTRINNAIKDLLPIMGGASGETNLGIAAANTAPAVAGTINAIQSNEGIQGDVVRTLTGGPD